MRNKKFNNLEISRSTCKMKRSFEICFEIPKRDEIFQNEMKCCKLIRNILNQNEKS
jgi:hypothetical protein